MSHPLEKFKFCPVCGSNLFREDSEKSNRCGECGFELFMNPSAAAVAFIRNAEGRLLVTVRNREPAKGTLDLPGGFSDIGETSEESVCREVKEETGLTVSRARLLFSLPNRYLYSGIIIPTLDFFYECEVEDATIASAADDVAECIWMKLEDIHPEQFGLDSIREGVIRYLHVTRLPFHDSDLTSSSSFL
ncbi:MAG: NUDIX domain-containing protein [Prevotella sp.]|nr:NUDIX domain-containing protein [Prevotella sp.]